MDADFSLHRILTDSTRRRILLQLNKTKSLSYMELMNLLKIRNTGRLNYHLKILGDLIEKRKDGKYQLTQRGKQAIRILENNHKIFKKEQTSSKTPSNVHLKLGIISILAISVLLSFLLLSPFITPSYEQPEVQWSKTYEGLTGYSIIQTFDEGFLVIGSNATYSFEARGYVDYNSSILKINSFGDLIWQKTLPYGEYLLQTKDGGYAVAGTSTAIQADNESFYSHFFLAKLDSQGNLLWNKTLEGDKNDEVYSLIDTNDGGYAIVGRTSDSDHYTMDAFLVKTDASGDVSWSRTYGESEDSYAWSITQTSDQGYAIVGTAGASFWLIKTDSNGNMQWNRTYYQNLEGQTTAAYARSGTSTSDGGHLIVGALSGIEEDVAWVVKTDQNGDMQWNRTYKNADKDVFNHAVQTKDGGYVFSGNSDDNAWVVKTDSKGNVQWDTTFDGSVELTGKSIVETADGGYALVGTSSSNIWILKIETSPENISMTLIAGVISVISAVMVLLIFLRKRKK